MKLSAQGLQVHRISLPRLALLLIAAAMFWHLLYVTCGSHRKEYIIASDAAGYYAYLPANFIYHDPEYKFCIPGEQKVDFPGADFSLFMNITKDGKLINKYFIGTAFMELPFFLIAYGSAPLFGYHMNGYSFPFQMAVALAAIFYVLIGLGQVRRLLEKLGISEPVQAVTLLLLFFGTNLYYYTLGEPGMSHAYSFTMMAVLLNHAYNVFHLRRKGSIVWMLSALALLFMIRPVNGVAVFAVPFIAGSWKTFTEGIRFCLQHYWRVAAGAAIFLFLLFVQLLMYKRTAGSWLADSYSGEHLILSEPHILEILFSWKKGWFIYTPVMFVALGGLFFLRNSFRLVAFLLLMGSATYVISCWELWWYGGSFGMRPLIEYYPVMAVPLALLLQRAAQKWAALLAVPAFGFLLVLNLVQLYQYFIGILPYNDMTAHKYRKIFFKTSADYIFLYDPGTVLQHKLPWSSKKRASFTQTFEDGMDYGFGSRGLVSNKTFSGGTATVINADVPESSGIRVKLRDAFPDSTQIAAGWLVVRAKIFLHDRTAAPKMIISIHEGEHTFLWTARALYFGVDQPGAWQDFSFAMKIPADAAPDALVSAFMLHNDRSVAYADDITLDFYVAK